ncbi:MAG TPA: carbohydrate-binding protein [Bacillota bacterium]
MGIMQTVLNALGLNEQNNEEFGSFDDDRISWNPDPARPGETVEIEYRGLLPNSGADQVYLHYGFDSWNRQVRTIPMEKKEDGAFRAAILAEGEHEINFCFKDAGENWDNNNGNNWTLHLV